MQQTGLLPAILTKAEKAQVWDAMSSAIYRKYLYELDEELPGNSPVPVKLSPGILRHYEDMNYLLRKRYLPFKMVITEVNGDQVFFLVRYLAPAQLSGSEWRSLIESLPPGLLRDFMSVLQGARNGPITFGLRPWLIGAGSADDMNAKLDEIGSPFQVSMEEDPRGPEYWNHDQYFLVRRM